MYVCGSTVYSDPHIGHGRFALVWDIIRRYLTWTGLEVDFVSNVTDIDDKIIARARAEGLDIADVAKKYEASWWDSMDRLGVGRPTSEPHATDFVDRMILLIASLVSLDRAYVGGDGVYFVVESVADYGLLANQPLESLRVGARVSVDTEAGKRSPLDFALWKFAKPGEPFWPSPWGDGRPGWHTECVVMALDLLGDDFDLHGGGLDLAFPHHENERAQAVADGHRFARRWAHSGMVVVEGGEKMSKSLGNVTSLSGLLSRYDPRAYRLLVLQSHYRSPLTVTDTTLAAAAQGMERLDALARRFPAPSGASPDAAVVERFRSLMDEDLGTVQAFAVVFDTVKAANTLADQGDVAAALALAAAVYEMCRAVGLEVGVSASLIDEGAASLATARDEARRQGDYAAADTIRRQLQAEGWIVEDTPAGTVIRR